MKSQFFKVIPHPAGAKPQDPMFVWIDSPNKEKLAFLEFTSSDKFINGTKEVIPAIKEDPDFQRYVVSDITQVQKDIDKLETLKENLVNAMR